MDELNEGTVLKEAEHHKQLELCETRPAYRQGRKLLAVKVYTINSESSHLFIYGVPKINLRNELKSACLKYGKIKSYRCVIDYKTELFTECYHVQFERIQSARVAKRLLDNKSFYGGILHVCYAPEYETINDTRNKLQHRLKDVRNRLEKQNIWPNDSRGKIELDDYINNTRSQLKKKRKYGTAFKED